MAGLSHFVSPASDRIDLNHNESSQRIIIFDTTLRDGEQSPGASMTKDEKIRIAKQLAKLGVDVIEAGFAASSQGDFDAIKEIAQTVTGSKICSLARANERDIERAAAALKLAEQHRIHTFIATSPIHMEKKLRMTAEQVFERAQQAVRYARQFSDDVEFSAEDASRSNIDFLCRIIEAVINEGATTINLPDTVGYMLPDEYGALFKTIRERVPNADKAIFSVHCHNDLGLAVANALMGVKVGGARQIECTINGLGERAGNTALEEVVMALKTRRHDHNLISAIDTRQIVPTSKLVAQITGFSVQPNKAVVGANAFAHASGIHQDGVIKARETYEIMRAEEVGWEANRIVLGKLSGRNAVNQKLSELGIAVTDAEQMNRLFEQFKALADKKTEIYDEDLLALVSQSDSTKIPESIQLVSLSYQSSVGRLPSASIEVKKDGQRLSQEANGNGPVDAVFTALERLFDSNAELILYSINAITGGAQAQGEVTVRLKRDGQLVNGVATDPDIVTASAKAYINALNRLDCSIVKVKAQL